MSAPTSGEFEQIARYFAPLAKDYPLAFDLTDDAALIRPELGQEIVVTTDCMVAGVHFFPDDAPERIARKLLRVNLSDLAAMGAVPVDKAGVGSGVLNSFRQVGGSVGIALMGAIVAHEAAGRRTPDAFMDGFSLALLVAAGIAFVGAIVAAALVRPHEMTGTGAPEAPAVPEAV